MRSAKTTSFLLGLVAVLLLANYFVTNPPPVDIRVVAPPEIIASLPHWVAEDEGFYDDENITVHTVSLTNSALMVQALSADDADILPAVSLVEVLNSVAGSTLPPQIFSHSRMRLSSPFDSLLVSQGAATATLRDLPGKRIAVYPGTTASETLRHFLSDNNIDSESITFIPLPPPEHVMALQRGDVTAAYVYEPTRTQLLQSGRTRELYGSIYASLNNPSAIGVSVVSSRFVQERREVADRFFRVWDRSIQFIRTDTRAHAILATRLGISEGVAKAATWVDVTQLRELDIEVVRQTAQLFQEIGLVDSTVVVDGSLFFAAPR